MNVILVKHCNARLIIVSLNLQLSLLTRVQCVTSYCTCVMYSNCQLVAGTLQILRDKKGFSTFQTQIKTLEICDFLDLG